MRLRRTLAAAAIATAIPLAVTAGVASAHTNDSSVDCSGLSVTGSAYWESPILLSATVNGETTEWAVSGPNFNARFPFNYAGDNTWSYSIDPPGNAHDVSRSGVTEGCGGPVLTTTTAVPPVTDPPETDPPETDPPATDPPAPVYEFDLDVDCDDWSITAITDVVFFIDGGQYYMPAGTTGYGSQLPGDETAITINGVTYSLVADDCTPPTDPPATDPPPTDPPATDPPATDPPATNPPETDPPATDPEPTDPIDTTEPPAGPPTTATSGAGPNTTAPSEPLPAPTPTDPGNTPPADPAPAGELPATGTGTVVLVGIAGIALIAGALAIGLTRLRRQPS
ncbi:LPXTG cell wall anchor domain-containing protein [Desertimonas flava]|uniref:LPXTG cell wall anchor domain-containing protein n=1 Tax=Desertimonas flava TaxID=2064846 RepID=UPI000E34CDA4|nr:LPXTG cell wall anchor domain-containing protein [Desertimonas flava]